MRFLADENFPGDAVEALRRSGHDVLWIRTEKPGCADAEVLAMAAGEQRIILTFDKDFGELARRAPPAPSCGSVLFRVPMAMAAAGEMLASIPDARTDWAGHFAVIEVNCLSASDRKVDAGFWTNPMRKQKAGAALRSPIKVRRSRMRALS